MALKPGLRLKLFRIRLSEVGLIDEKFHVDLYVDEKFHVHFNENGYLTVSVIDRSIERITGGCYIYRISDLDNLE
jgi:hypothetical protein